MLDHDDEIALRASLDVVEEEIALRASLDVVEEERSPDEGLPK